MICPKHGAQTQDGAACTRTCPACGGVVSVKAASCPHCGEPFAAEQAKAPRKPARRYGCGLGTGCMALILGVIILLAIGKCQIGLEHPADPDAPKIQQSTATEPTPAEPQRRSRPAFANSGTIARHAFACDTKKHLLDIIALPQGTQPGQFAHELAQAMLDGTCSEMAAGTAVQITDRSLDGSVFEFHATGQHRSWWSLSSFLQE